MFPVFLCWILFQLYYTIGNRRTAGTDLLYEKDKLSIPVSTLVLMIVTITYKLVLVVLGTLVVIIRPAQIMHYLEPVLGWCYLGLLLNVFCVAFMMFLVFHPTLAANMMDAIIRGLGKIHLMKRTEYYREKWRMP